MKFKLIEEVRGSLKLLSVNVAAIWALIVGALAADPMIAVTLWNGIPAEIRELLPPWVRYVVAAGSVFGTIYLARVIKQPVTKAGEVSEKARGYVNELKIEPEHAKALAKRVVELQTASEAEVCTVPPEGWVCTRPKGHTGPCAALPKG